VTYNSGGIWGVVESFVLNVNMGWETSIPCTNLRYICTNCRWVWLICILQNYLTCLVSLLSSECATVAGLTCSISNLSSELSGFKSHLGATGISDSVVRGLFIILLVTSYQLICVCWLVLSCLSWDRETFELVCYLCNAILMSETHMALPFKSLKKCKKM